MVEDDGEALSSYSSHVLVKKRALLPSGGQQVSKDNLLDSPDIANDSVTNLPKGDQDVVASATGEHVTDTPFVCNDRRKNDGIVAETLIEKTQRLVAYKKAINSLLEDNKDYLRSLQRAVGATVEAEKELQALELCRQKADTFAEDGEKMDVMPLHATRVKLPLHPSIYKSIPLLGSQAEDNELFRLLCTSSPWTKEEVVRLERAVLRQCLRVATLRLAQSAPCPDHIFEVATGWSKEELFNNLQDEGCTDFIDWHIITDEVEGTHTLEDCRTRWLMMDRPGLETGSWNRAERERLHGIIQARLSRDQSNVIRDWNDIAVELDTHRSAIDCFSFCQQEEMMSRLDGDTTRPDESALPASSAKQAASKTILWSSNLDEAIISYVARESGYRRPRLVHHLDNLGNIDFSKRFRGRLTRATDAEVASRWCTIKELWKADPDRYSNKKQKKSAES